MGVIFSYATVQKLATCPSQAIVYKILVPRLVMQVCSWLCACPLSPAMNLKD